MGETDSNGRKREITYHVGWKKGKIRLGEGQILPEAVLNDELALEVAAKSSRPQHRLWRGVWHPLPFVSWKAANLLLALLPIISLAMTVWLIYTLKNHG